MMWRLFLEQNIWRACSIVLFVMCACLLGFSFLVTQDLRAERQKNVTMALMVSLNCTSYVIGQVAVIMIIDDQIGCVRAAYTPTKMTLQQYMQKQSDNWR
jgi:cation transport ATPase